MKVWKTVLLTLLVVLLVTACGGGKDDQKPTISVEQIQTFAVATYQFSLTRTAMSAPSATSLPTQTAAPAVTFDLPDGTTAAPLATDTPQGLSSCFGLTFVRDVTIPDKTSVTPGQSFTKTWLVQNSGTCTWEAGFRFNVVGGDPMSGVAVTLNQDVQPGRQYEFSVPMVAPTDQTGEVKGTWQLADANGNFFGDGVYVLVIVGSATPAGPTATETPIPTSTP